MDRIINSLMETDAYKFSMGQAIYHQFPAYKTTWTFRCRNTDVKFTPEMVKEIQRQIKMYCGLRFKEDELEYLNNIRWLKGSYIDFLRLWHPRFEDFHISEDDECGLSIETTGTWLNTSMYEIPTLAIVNEVYFRMAYDYETLLQSAEERLEAKINAMNDGTYTFQFAEFGCRRRLSREWEDVVVRRFATRTKNCVGTSNVYLAKKHNITPIGTYAHEFVQMYQGIDSIPLAYTNYYAMKDWYTEYNGDNGTALTDTVTTDLFLLDFNRSMVNNYNGVRHDSGDPYAWGEKIIAHYKKFGVDPKTKLLLFSDSLNFDKAQELYNYFCDKAKVSFGIGTFVSNDTCETPLNIVIKLQYVNGRPVAKLSDTPEKAMCQDESYLEYLKRSVEFRLNRGKGSC